ncbi:amidase [Nocardia panacis]|nr:amidase [Nocardia panacis]
MSDVELCYKPAVEVLELFREKQLSPVELLDALIARAERVEPIVNAFASTYYDSAMAAARAAEARYQAGGDPSRPLDGLPVAAKSDGESAVEGTISSDGCSWLTDNVDDHTNPSMERLLTAGAVVFARTAMPEMGWTWTCHTKVHGVTRNPWNPKYSPGGSSAGSAASVVSGTSTVAMGTDALGSLRVPSAMCGAVTFKAPYGRNPLHPEVCFDFFNHIGPITRTVGDAALVQNTISGQHPLDHTTVPQQMVIPAELPDIRGMRIAYCVDLGYFPVTDEVRRETLAALDALRAAGARVEEVEMPWAEQIIRLGSRYTDLVYMDMFDAAIRDHPDEINDYTRFYFECAESVDPREIGETLELAGVIWAKHFGPLLQRYDALITPTLAFHEVLAENQPWEESITVRGKSYNDHDGVMTALFSIFSRCPVLALPSGFTDSGLPTGIQVAGRPFDDITVFRIGAALERHRPWLDVPERRPSIDVRIS